MQNFLVGGAVRDRLLGRPVTERDWVVVGATAQEMEALGYRRVGKGFPVFLHPETGEEYALARTETKTGAGYHGFDFHAGQEVTLAEDLHRRDLTINAMAEDADGGVIDPWGGQQHLRERLLHHVSDAFREDPVRILRVARFAARFHDLGFRVAPETMMLMREMVRSGEANSLVAERVWQETETALGEKSPDIFFTVLRDCGALAVIFPEIDALFGVPQPVQHHPEVDTGVHVLMALREAASLTDDPAVRFAVLTHDLGKGGTPRSELPRHVGHERRSVEMLLVLCERLGVPRRVRDLAVGVARYHGHFHRALELKPATILRMLEGLDGFRRPERIPGFFDACEADARGRLGAAREPSRQRQLLSACWQAAAAVRSQQFVDRGLSGEAIGDALRTARIAAIAEVRSQLAGQP
jgi:tRNA nucleotidyltransferase (CCA-adding enzyme)